MVRNLLSLGLLRNGKVYANKELAYQALTQTATNDGVAKLARYLYPMVGGDPVIRTLVGFYANADEMEDNGGGQSYYTILDIEGSAAEVEEIKQEIAEINTKIGNGIPGTTLTEAINDINAKIGEGFDENYTVADALEALAEELTDALAISLDVAGEPTSGYLKTYILSQGTGTGKTEIGRIDIPKDMVVSGGSLVHGTWEDEDTFVEDPDGPDTAIKLEFANADVIYINTKDLVDIYTAGDGIDVENNVISIKYNAHSEEFLIVDADGIRVEGIQAAIDAKADQERLEASDGISIASNQVKAVAAGYSAPAVKNPISVDKDGIKFANILDCGFFDDETVIASNASQIAAITTPGDTDVFLSTNEAFNAASNKTFKNIEASDIEAANQVSLAANEAIVLDDVDVTGDKGSSNAFILLNAPAVEVSNITVADGAKPYNVFEQTGGGKKLEEFNASNIKVDDVSLKHNVFNIYNVENDAEINITDGKFNLDVNNSNILRLANYTNATGVTVNFENIEWTYENTPNKDAADWGWAGIIIYQPASADVALSGDVSKIQTWEFNFKNCKYNGAKVTANNFGEKNQVFYLYNVGGDGSLKDPVAEGLTLNFE
jgi:hypothetical protein